MNTNTPRTNAAIIASDGQWSYVLADCSRELERELAEVTEQRDRLDGALEAIRKANRTCKCCGSIELASIIDQAIAAVKGGIDE